MSSMDPTNPFAAAQAVGKDATPAPATFGGLELMRAYHYIFENPNWGMNVLWGFLCLLSTQLIPFLGQLVFLGYQFEVIESLCLTSGTRYPDFDISRFGDYLGRSIWPFLMMLLSA